MVKFSSGGAGFVGRAPRATTEQKAARDQDAKAVKASAERKKLTRQKVILGAGLMALAAAGDREALALLDRIKANLPERDKVAFRS